MNFIDLAAQQKRIKAKIDANIQAVLAHGKYIMGPEVSLIEEQLALFTKTRHAIACASGTDALLMALMAYDVGPGDAVFTTPFTFFATAEVIRLLGATPVFVDIDHDTFNIDPEQLRTAVKALAAGDESYPMPLMSGGRLNPKGIIAVDLFGLPADYGRINNIAAENGLFVIEDAAQSLGALCNGNRAGGLAHIGCTSFFPAKPMGCYGDGGMCFTDDDGIARELRSIRVHGKGSHKYDNVRIGINGRLDTIQAAILNAKLDIFPEEIELRNDIAQLYTDLLKQKKSISIKAQIVPAGYRSAWAQYAILASDEGQRAYLLASLRDAGIPTAVYYPTPLHLQTALKSLRYKEGDFPASEEIARRIFSLPMHPYLTEDEQRFIIMNFN
jgi:UDP-2-acetamido-2-deoxy-ribo-hexuluronate aminotransferase